MRISQLGHACLLVEASGTRLLIDPGSFSAGFETLEGLDAILVTHQHADHLDDRRGPALILANPAARLLIEPNTVDTFGFPQAARFGAGETATVGPIQIAGVGGTHAANHDRISPVGNVGFLITDDTETTLFHPGDSYSDAPDGVDVLALPLNAPWARMSETLGFLRAVAPKKAFPIHDGLLNDTGRAGYLMHVETFGPTGTEVCTIGGAPVDF